MRKSYDCKQKILKFFCTRNNKIQGSMMQPLKTSNRLNLLTLRKQPSNQERYWSVCKKLKNLLLTVVLQYLVNNIFIVRQHIIGAKYQWITLIKKMTDWSCFALDQQKEFITLFSPFLSNPVGYKRTQLPHTPPLIGNVDPSRVVWLSWTVGVGGGENCGAPCRSVQTVVTELILLWSKPTGNWQDYIN